MKILAIESSCDETAAAVVENGTRILSNEISSQVEIHTRYGGVVPEVASRQHLLSIVPVIRQAIDNSGTGWTDLDGIAVTNGPGLAGSLLVGVNAAKALAMARNLPLIGVNHIEAHIYANWLEGEEPQFPLVCLIVSGGHTDLVLMQGHGCYSRLGGTRDDAAGEAFDKAARLLGLGYPGGPAIDRLATGGTDCVDLPRAWLPGSDDFSFSGLKTSLYRLVESGHSATLEDTCASFQNAVTDVLVKKTISAALAGNARQILLSGGVAANHSLRQRMVEESPIPVKYPSPRLCTDNAAMVGAAAFFHLVKGYRDSLELDILPDNKLY